MQGVAGGVRARSLEGGQALIHQPDNLSASTALQQSGSGGYARLIDALHSLDQGGNLQTLANSIAAINAEITTLQSEVATISGQIATINGQIASINTQITTINGQITALQNETAAITDRLNRAGIPP